MYYVWRFIWGVFGSPADLVASWRTHWEPFFLLSRLQSAALGTLTVLAIYRMGLRIFDRETAVVAAFLLALAFLHARDSHFGTADVAMTLMVLLSLNLLMRAHIEPVGIHFIMAGCLGGLAMATKYNAVLLFVPLAASVALHVHASPGARVAALVDRRILLFTVPFGLTYLVAAPYTLLAFDRFLEATQMVQEGLQTGSGFADLGYGWIYHLTFTLRYGVGVPLLVASLIGLIVAVRQDARHALLLCAFPIAYYWVAGSSRWVFARYMVPMVPFLCLLAAVAIAWSSRRFSASRSGGRMLAAVGLTIAVVFPSASGVLKLDRLLARPDSRVVAAHVVRQHVPAGSTVLQTGGTYAGVEFDRTDHFRAWAAASSRDAPVNADSPRPGRPDVILLTESPLGPFVEPSLATLAQEHYQLLEHVRGAGSIESGNVYDQQDAFYAPYAGFRDSRRPGPDIRIYRNRH